MLNFLFPEVKETRNRDRFIKVAERAREFTPDKPEVRDFINFLEQHHTVLDPTISVFEGSLLRRSRPRSRPVLEEIVPRFPPQVRRAMRSGALEVPPDKQAAYREAFPAMLRLLKAIHDAGVTIIPGTDALAGYTLHHELELYARAGIAPAEVLRMATWTPALVMGVNKDRGVIAPGKLADMILVDGDPTKNIRDINRITTVIKGGKVYDPAAIEKALGITPRDNCSPVAYELGNAGGDWPISSGMHRNPIAYLPGRADPRANQGTTTRSSKRPDFPVGRSYQVLS